LTEVKFLLLRRTEDKKKRLRKTEIYISFTCRFEEKLEKEEYKDK
jgi:hypothetical protein